MTRYMVYGKGGPYGSRTKRRVIPLSPRIQPLIEGHFALHESLGMSPRTIQRLLKRLANRATISRPVTPHVLRHYVEFLTMSSTSGERPTDARKTAPSVNLRLFLPDIVRTSFSKDQQGDNMSSSLVSRGVETLYKWRRSYQYGLQQRPVSA